MMTAVIGSSGLLGSELADALEGKSREARRFSRDNLNLEGSIDSISQALVGSDVIVNCVAYTAVDLAESEPEKAHFGNSEIPAKLVAAAKVLGARLLHVSTDYVFEGVSSTPYQVNGTTNPTSVYGESKRQGEEHVLSYAQGHVVRTAWLYGARGKCFPKTIASKLLAGQRISVVGDQVGSPTHTKDLSELLIRVGLIKEPESIYHGVSSGSASWFSFALAIASSLDELAPHRLSGDLESFRDLVSPTTSEAYPTPAKRPAFSLLQPSVVDGYSIPSWQEAWKAAAPSILAEYLN